MNARLVALFFLFVLIIASFVSLDLHFLVFFETDSVQSMGRFLLEFMHPDLEPQFVLKVWYASLETIAMSALSTLIAAFLGLLIAFKASGVRPLLNVLRAVPELVWASLLLIAVGLGPFAGTLALALHTTGVLGRLYLEAIENQTDGPAFALRAAGASSPSRGGQGS